MKSINRVDLKNVNGGLPLMVLPYPLVVVIVREIIK